ncbi:MAG: terminase, partial [Hydrogenovibrio crunogenus]|nr:terminase [Hydrogenovibrio crunogenus]
MNVKDDEKIIYNRKQSQAFGMYLRQMTPAEIAAEVCVTARAVQKWIEKFNWKELRDDDPPETVLQKRIKYLMWIDEKSDRLLNELDMLLKHHYGQRKDGGDNSDNGKPRKRRGGRPSNKAKNDISGITKEMLDEFRENTFFLYQLNIWATKQDAELNWMRFYLKSRQIGLTYYFAYEAFEDAVLTGDNQIFLSASKKQSEIFKTYIRKFALTIGEVDLKGKDEITLSNGATFYFLSTNSRTSQGYSGHLYI